MRPLLKRGTTAYHIYDGNALILNSIRIKYILAMFQDVVNGEFSVITAKYKHNLWRVYDASYICKKKTP